MGLNGRIVTEGSLPTGHTGQQYRTREVKGMSQSSPSGLPSGNFLGNNFIPKRLPFDAQHFPLILFQIFVYYAPSI